MEKSEKIIAGPESTGKNLTGSLAENLIPRMKAQPKDFIIQVDIATGESVTSHEFLRMCLEVTEGMIDFGLGQEDVVVLLSPNNITSMATTFGIFFTGALFAPIDYNLKPAEWKQLLKQFKPKYVICEDKSRETVRNCLAEIDVNAKIILIDSKTTYNGEFFILDDIKKKVDVDNYVPRKVPDPKKKIAIILCSSGSTGFPKGVALSHYTLLVNSLAGEDTNIPKDPFVITSPLSWISGVLLMLISCYSGIKRFIPKTSDPDDVMEAVQLSKTFFLLTSPSSLLTLVGHPSVKKYDLSSLKVFFSAGAVLGMNGVKKIKDVLPNVNIVPTYGLTESGGSVTSLTGPYKNMVLGKVVAGVQIKVVDPDTGESLGPNQTGECRVKTDRMMIGYFNNEEATKAAFDENGWLRTGDLVYYDDDEEFYIVGRIKEVVKCKSYQVSLVELEAFIVGIPGVKDAAVVPIPHEIDLVHFKALVVKDPKSDVTADDIIRTVEGNFSYQKHLHEGVEFVSSLPRTEVGKLRRGLL